MPSNSIVVLLGQGKDPVKNQTAAAVLARILDNANWINVHQLPVSFSSIRMNSDGRTVISTGASRARD